MPGQGERGLFLTRLAAVVAGHSTLLPSEPSLSLVCTAGVLRVLLPHLCVNKANNQVTICVCPSPSLPCSVSIAETKGNQASVITECCQLAFGKEALASLGSGCVCLGLPDPRLMKLEEILVLKARA